MGSLAIGAAGALIASIAVADLFLTVFNYDGFSLLSTRFHTLLWRALRTAAAPIPDGPRHDVLSIASAGMLPATVVLWLGLEIVGFAMMYDAGLVRGSFAVTGHHSAIGTAFYLGGGAISSLTFGDAIPRTGLFRGLADLETCVGLATFTLALGYVVETLQTLRTLDALHAAVRRHAEDPEQPASIVARHFQGGRPEALPALLQRLTETLEAYEQGLRRYPVAYYFHTRRIERAIPHVFAALGDVLALLRFGLPSDEPMTRDPWLAALVDEFVTTLQRLQRSFVGPIPLDPPEPLPEFAFRRAYEGDGDDGYVQEFRSLERRARTCAASDRAGRDPHEAYERYREWLPFEYRRRVVLERVADALGYERP